MKLLPIYCVLILVLTTACQQAKETSFSYQAPSLEELQKECTQDSLQQAFCKCLLEDSLSNQEKLAKVEQLLAQNVDINESCKVYNTSKYKTLGDLAQNVGAAIGNLLSRGKPFSKRSSTKTEVSYYPPVLIVAEDTAMIRAFAEHKADLNKNTPTAMSVTEYWIQQNDLASLKLLASLGADFSKAKILSYEEKTLDYLLENGAKKEAISLPVLFKNQEYPSLISKYQLSVSEINQDEFISIVRDGKFRTLEREKAAFLLQNGVSSDFVDAKMLEDILDQDFEIENKRNYFKEREQEYQKWLKLLEEYEVNWNQCGSFGRTPLTNAVLSNDVEQVRFLLTQGADPHFICNFAGKPVLAIENAKSGFENLSRDTSRYRDNERIAKAKIILELLESK